MRIFCNKGGEVGITVSPGDCLLLAEACRDAAENQGEKHSSRDEPPGAALLEHAYDSLAVLFDALALVGAAACRMGGKASDEFTLPAIREEWSPLPREEWGGLPEGARE